MIDYEKAKENKVNTRSKAIRLKCLDCMGGSSTEVKACVVVDCPLWHFRLRVVKEDNPFLDVDNFKGKEKLEALKVIQSITKH